MSSGAAGEPLVWYAAYGSNLWTERFLAYLTGGPVTHSPAGRIQTGARDPSPPRSHQPLVLPHRLFFARSSTGWAGGGVAFIDPTAPPPPPSPLPEREPGRPGTGAGTLARLWLITAGQFLDVARQENGRPSTRACSTRPAWPPATPWW